MDSSKFERLVRDFPFITKIVAEENLSADSIGNIKVKRGDRNLLEVKPGDWAHDVGTLGNHEGHRLFWCVVFPGEVVQLKTSWWRSRVPHGTTSSGTEPIGVQLLSLNRDVQFVVEIHEEGWDFEEKVPSIVIYKMQGFNWQNYCRPIA